MPQQHPDPQLQQYHDGQLGQGMPQQQFDGNLNFPPPPVPGQQHWQFGQPPQPVQPDLQQRVYDLEQQAQDQQRKWADERQKMRKILQTLVTKNAELEAYIDSLHSSITIGAQVTVLAMEDGLACGDWPWALGGSDSIGLSVFGDVHSPAAPPAANGGERIRRYQVLNDKIADLIEQLYLLGDRPYTGTGNEYRSAESALTAQIATLQSEVKELEGRYSPTTGELQVLPGLGAQDSFVIPAPNGPGA